MPFSNDDIRIVFIGGGNMAQAIIGGLREQGLPARKIDVLEPDANTRSKLGSLFNVSCHQAAGSFLAQASVLLWAVKPQMFLHAAQPVSQYIGDAAQISIMAGLPLKRIAAASGNARIVRCMPNTPALVGQGISALFAAPEAPAQDKELAELILRSVGEVIWVEKEELLDSVTALSGSGPAYVFYFLEAMQQAGSQMGLTPAQARLLAQQTFMGSATLAARSDETLSALRERVTSQGGTTFAALSALDDAQVQDHFIAAMQAAYRRAQELGEEAGK